MIVTWPAPRFRFSVCVSVATWWLVWQDSDVAPGDESVASATLQSGRRDLLISRGDDLPHILESACIIATWCVSILSTGGGHGAWGNPSPWRHSNHKGYSPVNCFRPLRTARWTRPGYCHCERRCSQTAKLPRRPSSASSASFADFETRFSPVSRWGPARPRFLSAWPASGTCWSGIPFLAQSAAYSWSLSVPCSAGPGCRGSLDSCRLQHTKTQNN